MKKENLSAFFKGKGFYAALAVGAAALLAVGIISTNMISTDNNKEELAKNPSSQVAENARQGGETEKKEEPGQTKEEPKKEAPKEEAPARDKLTGNDAKQEPAKTEAKPEEKQDEEISDLVKPEETDKKAPESQDDGQPQSQEEAEEDVASVLSPESQINNLSFQEEDGLLWPVHGEVILPYSMDKPVYFQTLAQYKCNSAVMIGAEENAEVVSAATAVITDISEEDETGVTVTASLGNDYQIIYGQLTDVQVNVGDTVEAGTVLGKIAAPTKYYIEEGSNLYLKVLSQQEPIDPLLLLE